MYLTSYYSKSPAGFSCPSSTENFGNVVLEAMISALAVIGDNAGGVKEIIKHKQNDLKFKVRGNEELIHCIKFIMNKTIDGIKKS
nr:glycosyltransferase [Clostridium botulinum]